MLPALTLAAPGNSYAGETENYRIIKRGKLSEAVEKAKDPDEEDRQVEDSEAVKEKKEKDKHKHKKKHREEGSFLSNLFSAIFNAMINEALSGDDDDDKVEAYSSGSYAGSDPQDKTIKDPGATLDYFSYGLIGAGASGPFSPSPDVSLAADYSLILDYQTAGHSGFGVTAGYAPMTAASPSFSRFEDINFSVYGKLSHGGYTNRSFYTIYSLGLHYHAWKYANPLVSFVYDTGGNTVGTDTIYSDGIFAFSAEIGAGKNIVDSARINITPEIRAGYINYMKSTTEQFDNDYLKNFLYVKIGVKFLFCVMEGI